MFNKKTIVILILVALMISISVHGQFFRFGKNKVNYDKFDWRLFKTPHFDLYYYPEEEHLLNSIVQWLESGYIYIAKKYNWTLSRRIPVFFYKTKSEWEQTTIYPAFLPVGVEAFSEPLRNRFVVPLDQPPAAMRQLIVHEMTHTFQYDILYGFSVPKQIFTRTPLWFMEGMAEHTARGFTTDDEMRVRDIVIHDLIPPIRALGNNQFVAYQLGQTIIDYIVERYNQEGFNELLLYMRRNGSGPRGLIKAFQEVFKVSTQEFSREWRKWLREKYMGFLVDKKEPEDYGKPLNEKGNTKIFSPAISPSGEIVAAYGIGNMDIDIFILSAKDGSIISNLTKGFSDDYKYVIGANITHRFHGGADLAWSPDSNTVAFFGRTDKKRTLFLLDAYSGEIKSRFRMELDQAIQPTFTPDGKSILFSAIEEGTSRDIYKLDIHTGKVLAVTKDEFFNYAPSPSSDGKYIYFYSNIEGYKKIFRIPIHNAKAREQITYGSWHDIFPTVSPDGKHLLYISDETGIFNIYQIDLENKERSRFTDLIGGAFSPHYTGNGKIIFSGYNRMRYSMYSMRLNSPLSTVKTCKEDDSKDIAEHRRGADDWREWNVGSSYLPPTEISKDKLVEKPIYDFFVEDASINAGMGSDGTLLTLSYMQFSDITAAIKFRVNFMTIGAFRNIGLLYLDQSSRFNWGFRIFDYTSFFISNINYDYSTDPLLGRLIVENMGASIFGNYPFSENTRIEFSIGYFNRDFDYPEEFADMVSSSGSYDDFKSRFRSGNFAPVSLAVVHDSVRYNYFGPMSGTKYKFSISHAPGIVESFQSFTDFNLDYRYYLRLSNEVIIAARLVGNHSSGESPNIFFFGGTNTMRGANYMELSGNTTFFGNFELRFPIATRIDLPLGIRLRGLRGVIFFDIGGAFYQGDDFNILSDDEFALEDVIASYGFGFHLRFIGIEFHFNWAKRTDFRLSDEMEYQFWMGYKF